MGTLAIVNIGHLFTGDLMEPVKRVDALWIEDGVIRQLANAAELPVDRADVVVDAGGTTVAPGLVDSHVHVVFGDFSPRQKAVDFIDSYMHGGNTTLISASEVHVPGCPRDPAGVKALAIAAQRCFANYRPSGVKVFAGSVILQPGLKESDFDELAEQGVWLAKAGFGDFKRQSEAAPMIRWAQERGMVVMCHTGGASIPGSSSVSAADLLELLPDVAGHVNGGTTALSEADQEQVVAESSMGLQLCQAGNLRAALRILDLAAKAGQLERIMIATDTPTGTGTMPLGMIKSVVELASLHPLPAATAWALASGNVGRRYRRPEGILAPGHPADLVIMDAPLGSVASTASEAIEIGDIPGITAVVIDGIIHAEKSRNTPGAARMSRVIQRSAVY